MSKKNSKKDLVEIFGYAPDDTIKEVRVLWELGACPFLNKVCTKHNHDRTIIYGTCSVTAPGDESIIICPNRLYADNYASLRRVAAQAYGENIPFVMYNEFVEKRAQIHECIVALGMNSGREVRLGRVLSMDWVMAHVRDHVLIDYIGIEVQSLDITGNYRDAWHGYKTMEKPKIEIPSSGHGLNWANVHKRLIPQLIRKGLVYSRSKLVTKGLFFILPDIVYQKFEDVVGRDIPKINELRPDTITVHTYRLGEPVAYGQQRELVVVREERFLLEDFATRFVSGPNLPDGVELDKAVMSVLGIIG